MGVSAHPCRLERNAEGGIDFHYYDNKEQAGGIIKAAQVLGGVGVLAGSCLWTLLLSSAGHACLHWAARAALQACACLLHRTCCPTSSSLQVMFATGRAPNSRGIGLEASSGVAVGCWHRFVEQHGMLLLVVLRSLGQHGMQGAPAFSRCRFSPCTVALIDSRSPGAMRGSVVAHWMFAPEPALHCTAPTFSGAGCGCGNG